MMPAASANRIKLSMKTLRDPVGIVLLVLWRGAPVVEVPFTVAYLRR